MANLFFPQLSTGAMAQFPFQKGRSLRTVQNLLADGTMIVSPDPSSSRIAWGLSFDELYPADMQALQAFFTACAGPYSPFTFIDPADNMFAYSTDLTNAAWTVSPSLAVTPGLADPLGGLTAFTVVNSGQTTETIGQTLAVPANYQYCFSVYIQSSVHSNVTLSMAGSAASSNASFACGTSWNRIVSAGRLNDPGTTLNVEIQLQPGQTVQIFGPQLEPQREPSRYRPTSSSGGVYGTAHWASNELLFSANGPNSFATSFGIESVL